MLISAARSNQKKNERKYPLFDNRRTYDLVQECEESKQEDYVDVYVRILSSESYSDVVEV